RRRHTRFSRDWSSDVCSSDLVQLIEGDNKLLINTNNLTCLRMLFATVKSKEFFILEEFLVPDEMLSGIEDNNYCNEIVVSFYNEIGRASCRERVYISIVEVPH